MDFDMGNQRNPFLCPECGGSSPGAVTMVSTEPNPLDPWSSVLETIDCRDCRQTIPAHLAERWENQSIEDPRREWREVYRPQRPRHPRTRR